LVQIFPLNKYKYHNKSEKYFTKHFVSAVQYAEDAEWVRMQLLLPCQHWCHRL